MITQYSYSDYIRVDRNTDIRSRAPIRASTNSNGVLRVTLYGYRRWRKKVVDGVDVSDDNVDNS